jgi:hypothetical protein
LTYYKHVLQERKSENSYKGIKERRWQYTVVAASRVHSSLYMRIKSTQQLLQAHQQYAAAAPGASRVELRIGSEFQSKR